MKKPKHGRQRPDQSNQTNVLLAVDRQNSVLAELKDDDLNNIRYSAYGQRSAERDPAASVAFNGEFRESDTGWYLLGNGYRAYNPVLRRFHSPDSLSPFGSGGLNAYAYCVGDPVNHADPTGHFAFSALKLPGFLFGFGVATTAASALTFGAAFFVPEDKRTALMIAGGVGLAVGAALMGVGGLRYRLEMQSKLAAARGETQIAWLVGQEHTRRIGMELQTINAGYSALLRQRSLPSAPSPPPLRSSSPTSARISMTSRNTPSLRSVDSSSSRGFYWVAPSRSNSSESSSGWAGSIDLLGNQHDVFQKRSSIRGNSEGR